ncbi:MAG TPA: biotin carboxylase N-terminal domain-containing protein [Actinomycetaceae bacterium]|nr:biotin carboxylase N-terminal domain-containing protein [Actinomycetaceae bacterium]
MGGSVTKVLIANRGEIAVRIIRTCRDLGIATVAVYAEVDRDSFHASIADEAFSIGGTTAQESYLRVDKILDVARRSGADALHPGYGFLAENADFAQQVIDAGLTWIGPPPDAIRALGDKVTARHIAQRVGAPLVPGTANPVADAGEVQAFAREHGLPIAIKAAFGGGGRGLKVARTEEEIPAQFESAVREATSAFGRGECFVERFLDRPRHVETQCLADEHGTVVVVSTRDCSLQRRHQKLVEEAPAPFLSVDQEARLEESSIAIMKEAGYVGAGTCEFLVGTDGTISFLEVNTRLQVEHTISEEITGLDLVGEQIRIARGEPLGYERVARTGHAMEFRINGEDPARSFLPFPGTLTALQWPQGPGVRIDDGVREGDSISGAFDSMIAKLIVSGPDRPGVLARARRAFAELRIEGIPTVAPFHTAILDDPDFTAVSGEDFRVHTTWIETDYAARRHDAPAPLSAAPVDAAPGTEERVATQRVTVEVGGKRLEVVLPLGLGIAHTASGRGLTPPSGHRGRRRRSAPPAVSGNSVVAPMQGTVVKVSVEEGQTVESGDLIVVLEAMKMEQPLTAHRAGTITKLTAEAGAQVSAGTVLCSIED